MKTFLHIILSFPAVLVMFVFASEAGRILKNINWDNDLLVYIIHLLIIKSSPRRRNLFIFSILIEWKSRRKKNLKNDFKL